ncbi:MAG: hypothetical protein CM1200mP22_25730 [Dehalococcoidia bacterium]|nr:MAG: hypothetical protein CM1200mP22_25730 [Dehalococcoidia bacterium]
MKFGVSLVPHNLKETAASASLAEDLGFDYVGIPDSQSLWKELYLSLGVVAGATSKVGIGPRSPIPSPGTRPLPHQPLPV